MTRRLASADFCPAMPRQGPPPWLWLAALSVLIAGFYGLLIVAARVPALGTLFPGAEFYRVALTLHVNFSQLAWFSCSAGLLWSLTRAPCPAEKLAVSLCAGGLVAMAVTPFLGPVTPVMSNYLPVLDSPFFLAGLFAFASGLALIAGRGLAAWPRQVEAMEDAHRLGLALAAMVTLLALALLAVAVLQLRGLSGLAYFEALFWAAGHVWQFALTTLLMQVWLRLTAEHPPAALTPRRVAAIYVLGVTPLAWAVVVPLLWSPLTGAYRSAYTELMRYASWPLPFALGLWLTWRSRSLADWRGTAIRLSLALFVGGLLLGTMITGQTTLVTAHYHGTIGAVTLALMAELYRRLPAFGLVPAPPEWWRRQLAIYGWGIGLMMLGLAGAGWLGAERKTPGNLGIEAGLEPAARLVMGLGGTLALVGIVAFAMLCLRALTRPATRVPAWSRP